MTDAQALAPTRIGSRRGGGARGPPGRPRRAPSGKPCARFAPASKGARTLPSRKPASRASTRPRSGPSKRSVSADAPPSGVEALTSVGAALGEDGRVRIPRRVVEKMLAVAGARRDAVRAGCGERHPPRGHAGALRTAGAAVHVYDPALGDHRDPTMRGSLRLRPARGRARQHPLLPADPHLPRHRGPHRARSQHPLRLRARDHEARRDLVHLRRAGRGAGSTCCTGWRARRRPGGPARSSRTRTASWCPPLRFATESCEVMEALIRGGMPILLLSPPARRAPPHPPRSPGRSPKRSPNASRGWSTSTRSRPATPPSSAPGRSSPTFAPARCPAARGEQALLSAACGQMARHYDLPGGSACAMSDSKAPDMQAGYERGLANTMAGPLGAEPRVRERRHARLAPLALPGEPRHRQRSPRGLPSLRAGDRGQRRHPRARDDARGLPHRSRPLPRPRADPAAHAVRVRVSRGRRPHEPQGVAGGGKAGAPRAGPGRPPPGSSRSTTPGTFRTKWTSGSGPSFLFSSRARPCARHGDPER